MARLSRNLMALTLGAGLLAACGEPTPPSTSTPPETTTATSTSQAPKQHLMELEVTGTATLSLTFTLDGKATEEKAVALPWRKTVTTPYGTGRHEWKLTMQHSGGTLAATATVDGKLVTRTGGSGSPGSNNTANLTGSFTD